MYSQHSKKYTYINIAIDSVIYIYFLTGEVYIAVEFCENGNLHNYLRAYRTTFLNLVKDGKLCGFRYVHSYHLDLLRVAHDLKKIFSGNYAYNRKGSYSKQMSTLELIMWSTQIANGLDYLSSVGVSKKSSINLCVCK